mgnify:CR=1 FL=1
MKTNYDIIVVGGGPAGSMAAWEAAKKNVSVCLLEKDRDIGYPVRCGEAIGHVGLSQFVEPKDTWIAATISGVDLVGPNGNEVGVDFKSEHGYILNRRIFDYDLSRFAANAGAEIYTKSYVKSLIQDKEAIKGVVVDYLGEERKIYAKIIIGADGIASRVGRWAGIRTQIRMKDMESAIQYSVSGIDVQTNKMIMYVGSEYAPGGYLWIFPKGERFANIGLGISGSYSKGRSAKEYLDQFMREKFPSASILTTMCGGVPCGKPIKNPVKNGIMLVGDAAHQINPMTGGGIASGMKGGYIAGQIASDSIKESDFSAEFLSKYSKRMMEEFGKNHDRFYRIKESIHKLSDQDLNAISDKVLKIDSNKRTLASIFKAAVSKKPSLIIDVLKVFAGI